MKRELFFFILLINLFAVVDGQSQKIIDSRIQKEVDILGIDTLLIYSFPCSGCSTSDSCRKEESHYLFWQQDGRFFLKRFDYCQDFEKIELRVSPLKFYLKYKKIIDGEQMKPPTYQEIKKIGNKLDTSIISTSVDHSYYHKLTIRLKGQTIKKTVDIYDLNSIKSDEGLKNMYYDYNQKTKLKALIDKITVLIKEFKMEKRFIPYTGISLAPVSVPVR